MANGSGQVILNPKPFLQNLVDKNVFVKLKWGMEYKGKHYPSQRRMRITAFVRASRALTKVVFVSFASSGKLVSVDNYYNLQVRYCVPLACFRGRGTY